MHLTKSKINFGLPRLSFFKPFEPILFADDSYESSSILDIMNYSARDQSSYFEDEYIKICCPYSPTPKTMLLTEIKPYTFLTKDNFSLKLSSIDLETKETEFVCFRIFVDNLLKFEGFLVEVECLKNMFRILNKDSNLYYRFGENIHMDNISYYINDLPVKPKPNQVSFLSNKFDLTKDEFFIRINNESVKLFFESFIEAYRTKNKWIDKFYI